MSDEFRKILPPLDPAELDALRKGRREGTRWAAYAWAAIGEDFRGFIFLRVGEGCTFSEPPDHAPDGSWGAGWKYRLAGFVDLESGELRGE